MRQQGFSNFFWGFLFIMFDFRLQGIDIMPDIIGFILFALGFQSLAAHSHHFAKGGTMNWIVLILSIFAIYERPNQGGGVSIHPIGFIVGLASLALLLLVVYHLLMGIKEMATRQHQMDIVSEADKKWSYFWIFQLAGLLMYILIFIPPLFVLAAIAMFVVMMIVMVMLMQLMRRCGEQLR